MSAHPSARPSVAPTAFQHPSDGLLRLDPRTLWAAMTREPLHFWALCSYVMIEYVRPQQVYPAIDVLPWGSATLALTIASFLLAGLRGRKPQVLDTGMVFFTIVLVLSSLTAFRPDVAREGWSVFLNWILLYALTSAIVTTPRRLLIFLGLFLLWSLKMSQHGARTFIARGFSFANWGAVGGPGWFHNSGEFAIQMCVFLPMALHFLLALREHLPRWAFWAGFALLPGTAAISLLASSSRGGQLAAAVVVLVLIAQLRGRARTRGFAIAAVLVAGLWLVMPAEQKARFTNIGEDRTSTSRLTYWADGLEIMNAHPLLGIGYDNWIPYYHRYYDPFGEVPHNIFIEAGSEMGYTGLLAFLFLIAGTFLLNLRTRGIASSVPYWGRFLRFTSLGLDAALVGYLASGFFVTVLYYPYFWMNLAFTAALHETARTARRRARAEQARAWAAPPPPSPLLPRQPPPVAARPQVLPREVEWTLP